MRRCQIIVESDSLKSVTGPNEVDPEFVPDRSKRTTPGLKRLVFGSFDPRADLGLRNIRRHQVQYAGGTAPMNDTLDRWWRQPDHFDWLSAYIADHGLQPITRGVISVSAATVGLAASVLTLSPDGPHGIAAHTASLLASALGVAMAGIWLIGWPSRRGSMMFALVAIACFATVCLAQSDPIIGLMGCSAFATIGGYIALFHTPRFMACYLTVATATTAVLAVRVAAEHDVVLGASFAAMIGAVNLSVSFVVHMLMNFLRVDVLESERDPLTSLLNRRGFDRAARTLLATPHKDEAHLIVAMVDLDRFKVLNDDLGHAAGDRVLTAVADVLRAHTGAAAVIGRVGGEEFLVAEVAGTPDPAAMADRVCHAIAATPYPITASIGTATAALRSRDDSVPPPALTTLIDMADSAMYEAKRRGGNRTQHCAGLGAPLTQSDQGDGAQPPSAGAAVQRSASSPESLFPNG
jgi:diguanylate cyclase (GGDEF)-like protein